MVSKPPPKSLIKPKRKQTVIDIYNSTSTGHQTGGGVSKPSRYHKSRTAKLQQQFHCNPPPVPLIASSAIKSTGTDGNAKVRKDHGTSLVRERETASCMPVIPPTPVTNAPAVAPYPVHGLAPSETPGTCGEPTSPARTSPKHIFTNCTIYVNGTTAPLISDIMLKRHLSSQGAAIAIGLAKKSVTHVIIGKPNSGVGGGGVGGGLAAGKFHKELTKNGKPVKFVSVNWVLDSLKAGKRLPETQYTVLGLHSEKQRNILSFARPSDS